MVGVRSGSGRPGARLMIASAMSDDMTLSSLLPRRSIVPEATVLDGRPSLCKRLRVPAVWGEALASRSVRRLRGTLLRDAPYGFEEATARPRAPDSEGSRYFVHTGLPPPLTTAVAADMLPDRLPPRTVATPAVTLIPEDGFGSGQEQLGTLRTTGRRPLLRRRDRAVAVSSRVARRLVPRAIHSIARARPARTRADFWGSAVGRPRAHLGTVHPSAVPCWLSVDDAAQPLGGPADPAWIGLTDCPSGAIGRLPAAGDAGDKAGCQQASSDLPMRSHFGLDIHRTVLGAHGLQSARGFARVARAVSSPSARVRAVQGIRIGEAVR